MKKPSKDTSSNPFPRQKGFRILGIGKQEAIKYFFGGNAALSIIIITLIIGFLIYHSSNFFPKYRDDLALYRKSGQEFVDYLSTQLKAQKELQSLATQAREYEIERRLGALYRVASVHNDLKIKALKQLGNERKEYRLAKERLEALSSKQGTKAYSHAEQEVNNKRNALLQATSHIVFSLNYSDLSNKSWKTDRYYLKPIRLSIIENIVTGKKTAFMKGIAKEEALKRKEIDTLPFIVELNKAKTFFAAPLPVFQKYINNLRTIAASNKAQAIHFTSSAARKKALEEKLAVAATPEQKERVKIEIARIITVEPDYVALTKPITSTLKNYQKIIVQTKAADAKGFASVPKANLFLSKTASKKIHKIYKLKEEIFELFDNNAKKMQEWDVHTPYPLKDSITGFLMGTKWITNSSWQDIYGIIPLLSGSVAVAVIAILIAVPFSVGGAIYVNRLASPAEKHFIKPFVEFIGAIPSIVLAFFGVVVLGSLIQEYSQSPYLSWIPGFPVESRLTILNAGLLLALMSVPTIFTLCEDALNNVPKAYKEASLALGATQLQTVLNVILPSCASGIIAAVLLGFGRIIGETMVVLLVMGGRIAIPESFTDPAHSMTGILAQEIGEVDEGSLHWGALFMVGLVLFIIALTLNYVSQKVLKKYTQHG